MISSKFFHIPSKSRREREFSPHPFIGVFQEFIMGRFGLYLHIPFCDGKCHYCSFFCRRMDSASMDEYTMRLCAAVASWGGKIDKTVNSVYFGGGTPSLLGHRRLIGIFDTIRKSFAIADDAEITVEVNPSSADGLDFAMLKRAGFNRLSIGLQSSNDNELRLLGRRHSAADAKHTVEAAKAAGFDNISLDVMLAIPEQTKDSLCRTLDFCAGCGVRHISAYILKIEEGTRFYRDRDTLGLFDDDAQAAIYEYAVERLGQLGYHQYEISNFAVDGFESRHNLLYWHDEEYLGLGPSAHSFIGGKRFYYDNSFEAFYADRIADEGSGGDEDEYIMLALRLSEGLVFEEFEKRFSHPVSEKILNAARRIEANGLVKLTPSSLSLTVKGFLVSNSVIAYLLQNT